MLLCSVMNPESINGCLFFSIAHHYCDGRKIVFPGPPESVRDCRVENQSSDSVVIACTAGYDGGLKQSFVLEVYERRKEQLMKNLTQDDDPRFRMESLSPKTPYAFVIYSYNMKGRSSRTSLNYQITPVLPQDFVSNDPSASAAAAHPSSSSPSSASAAGSPAPSSSSAEGDSPSDSLNGANESRSDDGAMPSSSSSPAAAAASSSLSSLLMRVALLPVLGIVSGLILTFILLGVIFSVLHSIRKQERSGKSRRAGSQSTAGCSLGPVMPANRSLRSDSPTASCDSSAAFNRHVQESVSFNFLSSYIFHVVASFCHVSSVAPHLLPGGHSPPSLSLPPLICPFISFFHLLVRYCLTSFCSVRVSMSVCAPDATLPASYCYMVQHVV